MAPDRAPILYGLDIETDTATDGLDPAVGRVVAVAIVSDDLGDAVAPTDRVFADRDEARLLLALDRHLASLPAGVLVTWNGSGFDLPYLSSRAARAGVDLGLELELDLAMSGRHEPLPGHDGAYRARWRQHRHLDVYRVYRADVGPALRLPCSLKSMAALVGLAPIEVDASKVHELSPAEISSYVRSDARCTAALARRRWSTAAPAVDRLSTPALR